MIFLQGVLSTNFVVFSQKRVFHINFGGFPPLPRSPVFLVRTFPEEDTHDRN